MDLPHGCDLAGAWMIGAVDRYTCLFFQRKLPSEETAFRGNCLENERRRDRQAASGCPAAIHIDCYSCTAVPGGLYLQAGPPSTSEWALAVYRPDCS